MFLRCLRSAPAQKIPGVEELMIRVRVVLLLLLLHDSGSVCERSAVRRRRGAGAGRVQRKDVPIKPDFF